LKINEFKDNLYAALRKDVRMRTGEGGHKFSGGGLLKMLIGGTGLNGLGFDGGGVSTHPPAPLITLGESAM